MISRTACQCHSHSIRRLLMAGRQAARAKSNVLSKRSASRGCHVLCLHFEVLRWQLLRWLSHDLEDRIKRHNDGTAAIYTRIRRPVNLIYSESHSDKTSAVKRERQVKNRSHAKKDALVRGIKTNYAAGVCDKLLWTGLRRMLPENALNRFSFAHFLSFLL